MKQPPFFLTIIFFGLFVVGCAGTVSDSPYIKIGVMVPLSGDTASYGLGVKHGIDLAFAEWRAKGLSNASLVVEDSRCDGRVAVNAVNKLISVDRVNALIGEVCSGGTLAAAPIAEKNRIPMITPASTSPAVSGSGDYIFRSIPSDDLQGSFGADLVYQKGFRKLAVLFPNEDYGVGFSKVLQEKFTAKGGKIVAMEAFTRGSVDLRGQLLKIKNAGADALYLVSNSPDSALAALRQIKELGITCVLFGSEGVKSQEVAGLKAAEGLIITSVSSGTSAFLERYRAFYHEEPGPFAAQGYDACQAILLAIQKSGGKGPEIKKALYGISFEGASGKIAFDSNGDVSGNYDVFQVKKGVFELVR